MTEQHHTSVPTSIQDRERPPPVRYGCICSGISPPTLAAKTLGWHTKFFSEIEAFPRAVLSHHYPDIPLHADFTTINGDTYGTVDLLVGGTPCQSFSIAGKRLGLDDPRGNLALEYVRLGERLDAKWLVFENVPGLLSSGTPKGEDFATFISAVTGHEYRPPATGWQNAGIAVGQPGRWGIAWRILDAQYFGVAQRRRRLLVVGYRGDWRPAAAVLLEPESMCGDSPPSQGPQQEVAGTFTARAKSGGWGQDVNLAASGYMRVAGFGGGNCAGPIEVAACLTAKGVRQDFEVETFVTHTLTGEGFDASEDGTGRGTPLVPVAFAQNTRDEVRILGDDGSVAGALAAEPGMKQQTYLAFTARDYGNDVAHNLSPTLRSQSKGPDGHQAGSHGVAVCPINTQMALRGSDTSNTSREGIGTGEENDPGFTLQAHHHHAMAVTTLAIRGRDGGHDLECREDGTANAILTPNGGRACIGVGAIHYASSVRRLTPRECERLQGMPDDFTLIPYLPAGRRKLEEDYVKYLMRGGKLTREECYGRAADGPRYKAIGKSMAVPCMAWIFGRIDQVHKGLP